MSTYTAPMKDMQFVLHELAGLDAIARLPGYGDVSTELVDAVLEGAATFSSEVWGPLNKVGDQQGLKRHDDGRVTTPKGFVEAYAKFVESGWNGLRFDPAFGGQGLPKLVDTAVMEMWNASNMAFSMAPLLTQGAIEAVFLRGSDAQKQRYLHKMVSGEWTGTMNLTEPQAGSDVGALRTKAEPKGDGTYAITGQKIFITWGDSDVVENISHLVLARLPGAASGTKGISLFIVPKYLPDANGKPGKANSLKVVSLEHKLGIHGSPTCVMSYEGATGWLVGEENKGMAAMFTMMNNARLGVGMQGVGVAEAACQKAIAYAQERNQMGVIANHPDVRRMLATMRAEVFAARAIGLACAVATDMQTATGADDWAARAAFLTPIAKAYGTDVGCMVSEMAVQVHGGMGYIEETGVAQYYRDVRITPIYEGTNGIQAMDLVGRKMMDGGEMAYRILEEIEGDAEAARAVLPELACDVWSAAETLREATEWMVAQDMTERFAGAAPYLRAFARVLGAHYHLRAAMAEGGKGPRSALARVYIRRLLPVYAAHLAEARDGSDGIMSLSPDDLAA